MHKSRCRLTRIERARAQYREVLLDRLASAVQLALTEAEYYDLAAALERDIADGPRAEYTPSELVAIGRFDDLIASRPDIADIVRELGRNGRSRNRSRG